MRDVITTPLDIVEADLEAFHATVSQSPGVFTAQEPDATVYWSRFYLAPANVISSARIADADVKTRVPELLAPFIKRGMPFEWVTTPKTTTPALEAALAQAGLTPVENPAMFLALEETVDPGTPDDVYIDVAWPDHVEPVNTTIFAGFGLPQEAQAQHLAFLDTLDPTDNQFFIARSLVTGQPLGASTMHRRGNSVMMANLTTIEAARGRGIGRALAATMVNRAYSTDASTATAIPNDEAYQMYVDLGFRTQCNVVTWVWQPAD